LLSWGCSDCLKRGNICFF